MGWKVSVPHVYLLTQPRLLHVPSPRPSPRVGEGSGSKVRACVTADNRNGRSHALAPRVVAGWPPRGAFGSIKRWGVPPYFFILEKAVEKCTPEPAREVAFVSDWTIYTFKTRNLFLCHGALVEDLVNAMEHWWKLKLYGHRALIQNLYPLPHAVNWLIWRCTPHFSATKGPFQGPQLFLERHRQPPLHFILKNKFCSVLCPLSFCISCLLDIFF